MSRKGRPPSGSGGRKRSGKPGGSGSGRRPPPTRRSPTPARAKGPHTRGLSGAVGDRAGSKGGLGGDQVEGIHAVRELLAAGRRPVYELMVLSDRAGSELSSITELAGQLGVQVNEVGRNKLDAIARTYAPQGVVARAASLEEVPYDDLLPALGVDTESRAQDTTFLMACDGVTDPGNLGALLRTANAAGVTGVVLPRHRSAHISPAVTKAAAGAVEHLRFSLVGGLPAAIRQASEHGVVSVGLDMDGDVSIHDLPPMDQPVMVVLGAEGRGLSRLVRERCEVVASVPMTGQVESLNVSVAGALGLYEVVRQRNRS